MRDIAHIVRPLLYGSDVTNESRPVPGRSFGFFYDPIGNRVSSTEERDGVPVVTLYESNELNQYTRIFAPGEIGQTAKQADAYGM